VKEIQTQTVSKEQYVGKPESVEREENKDNKRTLKPLAPVAQISIKHSPIPS
jgi:hypothetical protein